MTRKNLIFNYIHIPSIKHVNEKRDIDAHITRFSCMNHNTVYLHEQNMIFIDLYCRMTSTMMDIDHHVMSGHLQ